MPARILVVDDDRKITALLRRTLGYEEYQVELAGDGRGGLLIARVRALLRRSEGNGGTVTVLSFADLRLDVGRRQAQRGPREIELTTKEFELLALFLRHPRQVLTRDVILEQVWSYNFGGEANVLEVDVGYLRNKLEDGGEPRLIHTIRGAGYVLREGG